VFTGKSNRVLLKKRLLFSCAITAGCITMCIVWTKFSELLVTIDLLRNSQDDLFSDDFGFKINKFVCNLAHIFILRRPLIILFKNIV
jgi:hypothetical protein